MISSSPRRRFRSIARSYFRKAHGVLLLYDVTSESSFLNMRAWVDQIQVSVETLSTTSCRLTNMTFFFTTSFCFVFGPQDSAEDKISICVIGNKVDLRQQHPQGTCVSTLHGEKLAKVSSFPSKRYRRVDSSTSVCRSASVHSAPRRLTEPCSAKPAPKKEPTWWRPFCTWPGETPEGRSLQVVSLRPLTGARCLCREVKKNAKLRRQSDSEVTLSPAHSKKTFSTCCRL